MPEPTELHRCADPGCPGRPYKASDRAHPPNCGTRQRPVTPKQREDVLWSVALMVRASETQWRRGHHVDRADGFVAGVRGEEMLPDGNEGARKQWRLGYRVGVTMRGAGGNQ